jgi:hypothetical protein
VIFSNGSIISAWEKKRKTMKNICEDCKHLCQELNIKHATHSTLLVLLVLIASIFAKESISQSSSLCNFLHPPVTSSLFKSEHFPQYSVLEHKLPAISPY